MYAKGLVLRIEVQYNSFYILLLLYNSHRECSVLYLMHAHTCMQNNLHNSLQFQGSRRTWTSGWGAPGLKQIIHT